MKFYVRLLFTLAVVVVIPFHSISQASELQTSKPEKVSVSAQRLEKIDAMARQYVADGSYSGIVTMLARHGKIIHLNAHGTYGIDNQTPMAADTLFRIYSMTKPITSIAAMMLYEEGKFHMTDPVSKHLPEFAEQKILIDGKLVEPESPMIMRQLFTHTAGLTYGSTLDNPVDHQYKDAQILDSDDLNQFTEKLATLPLRFEPGTRYHYSVSLDVLGAIIERLSGVPLDEFFETRIFQPLGMTDTSFQVSADKRHRLASDQYWDYDNDKIAVVAEDKQRDFDKVTMFSGGGGLVSTIGDYMKFCQMVLNGGSFNGDSLLGPKTVEFFGSDHLTPEVRAEGVGQYPSADLYPGQSMALGLGVIINPALTPSMSSKGELSWGGIAGTKFWIDPQEQFIGIAMVQLYGSPWPLRFDFKVAAYQALMQLN